MKKNIFLSLFLSLFILLVTSCEKDVRSQAGGGTEVTKICSLTFDDGPSTDPELTSLVLDKLEKYNVKATFFMVGRNINNSTKPVIKRIVASGHEIGNHSWSYVDMARMSAEEVKRSVSKTTSAIKKYAGITPKFFRAPNASTSSVMYKNINLPFAGGILGGDWPGGGGTTPAIIAKNIISRMKDGVIILLHDVQPKPHPTPDSLDIIIPHLLKQGYEFVTISELFKRKGVDPVNGKEIMWECVE